MAHINELAKLEKRFATQTDSAVTAIVTRTALRAFPALLPLTKDEREFDESTFLYNCRVVLLAGCLVVFKKDKSLRARAERIQYVTENSGNPPLISAAFIAAVSALDSATLHPKDERVKSAMRAFEFLPQSGFIENAEIDSRTLVSIGTPTELFNSELWAIEHPYKMIPDVLEIFHKRIESDQPYWSFWREWYQGFLDGTPMDWDLQRAVALIPDADWEQGPEHIAGVIEGIRARFELQKRIAELEDELMVTSISRHGIGGNLPPEPMDGAYPVAKELLVIWEPLQVLKEEVDADEPDIGKIRAALEVLGNALKAGLGWAVSKADLAVDTVIKWGIPAAGGGYFALNPDKLTTVLEAAKTWLSLVP